MKANTPATDMYTLLRITYALLLILMVRCESRQVEIVPGTYYLIGDAVGKSYAIGCMQFLREEKPFRLKFSAKNLIEFFPAISSTGEMSDQFKGFSGKYEIRGNRLIVVPLFQVTDTLYYKMTFVSKDSLVLQDGYGHLEPYKMHLTQKAVQNSYWKLEIESSANISTCSPYHMTIDTTGLITLTMRDAVFTRNLSNEMVRQLFTRINSIIAVDLRKEPVRESDVRSVKLVLWKSKGYEEVEGDPIYFEYGLKRLLLVFDDYVYNYSETKEMVLQ